MKVSSHHTKLLITLVLSAGLLSWAACASALHRTDALSPQPPLLGDGEEIGRSNWLYAQRAYPLPMIPPGARMHALEQLEREEARQRELNAVSAEAAAQLTWTPLGPMPIGQGQTFGTPRVAVSGRVSTVVLDPGYNSTTNQTVYLGAAQGGVWRSRDNGVTWTPLTDHQPSLAMGALALDPVDANIIYYGTLTNAINTGGTLWRSRDGGQAWTDISLGNGVTGGLHVDTHWIAVSPINRNILFTANDGGVWRTDNGVDEFESIAQPHTVLHHRIAPNRSKHPARRHAG